jgi:hypothetical protein
MFKSTIPVLLTTVSQKYIKYLPFKSSRFLMLMRRWMLLIALLYDSIEDFNFNVVSAISSSPLKIVLVTFLESINDYSKCNRLPIVPIWVASWRMWDAKYRIHAVRTSIARLITTSRPWRSSGKIVDTSSSSSCWQRYSKVFVISAFLVISLSAICYQTLNRLERGYRY